MPPLGHHILADLRNAHPDLLNDPARLERALVGSAQDAGATVIESSFSPFSPYGVTGFVIIQESHLAIHTWPESGYAALDVFTCGTRIAPATIVDAVAEALGATVSDTRALDRGEATETPDPGERPKLGAPTRSVWFTELQDDIALSLRHAGVVFSERSEWQTVEVVESFGYGRILLLDNRVAFTGRDEFVYHEMIAHVPALSHPRPERVLIVGGGDGGACREFLKHPSTESITVAEIDPTVTRAARDHFPEMAVALDDDRVTLRHEDGLSSLASAPESFDIVVVDSLVSAGDRAFDARFREAISAALRPGGVCVTQIHAPTLAPERFSASVAAQRRVFGSVSPYLAFLPTYSTGMLSFALSPSPDASSLRSSGTLPDLRYLNDDLLEACFALPAFVRQLSVD